MAVAIHVPDGYVGGLAAYSERRAWSESKESRRGPLRRRQGYRRKQKED